MTSMSPRRGVEAHPRNWNPFEHDVSADLFSYKDDWSIQAPEEIIQEAKRSVQGRRPGRADDVDALLKTKPWGKEDPSEKGYHIILPDNRVVSVENQLNRRLREELLGPAAPEPRSHEAKDKMKEEDNDDGQQGSTRRKASEALASIMQRIGVLTAKEEFLEPPKPGKKEKAADQSKGKGKGRRRGAGSETARDPRRDRLRKVRNPWYLPPNHWFSEELGKDPNETIGLGFPYDAMIMGETPGVKKEEVGVFVGDKDISLLLDTAKSHFQDRRHRLPHFLAVATKEGG
ncbi:unnamed protein product [Symbiodinium natans]|uniref:Uncharacterized protein n=1 Tax=Symbiodinium natans TaxID=878477 RepID=A0A812T930_9DINO|nr:unnamed protein product [Symbiodinium natans]